MHASPHSNFDIKFDQLGEVHCHWPALNSHDVIASGSSFSKKRSSEEDAGTSKFKNKELCLQQLPSQSGHFYNYLLCYVPTYFEMEVAFVFHKYTSYR